MCITHIYVYIFHWSSQEKDPWGDFVVLIFASWVLCLLRWHLFLFESWSNDVTWTCLTFWFMTRSNTCFVFFSSLVCLLMDVKREEVTCVFDVFMACSSWWWETKKTDRMMMRRREKLNHDPNKTIDSKFGKRERCLRNSMIPSLDLFSYSLVFTSFPSLLSLTSFHSSLQVINADEERRLSQGISQEEETKDRIFFSLHPHESKASSLQKLQNRIRG